MIIELWKILKLTFKRTLNYSYLTMLHNHYSLTNWTFVCSRIKAWIVHTYLRNSCIITSYVLVWLQLKLWYWPHTISVQQQCYWVLKHITILQFIYWLVSYIIPYTVKHSWRKLSWFVSNIHYVSILFVVQPWMGILVFYLQSRKIFSGKSLMVGEKPLKVSSPNILSHVIKLICSVQLWKA